MWHSIYVSCHAYGYNQEYSLSNTFHRKGIATDRLKFWPAPVIANFICSSTWRHIGSPCNMWRQNRCRLEAKPWVQGWHPVNCIQILWSQWHVLRFEFYGTCTHTEGHQGNHNRDVFLSLLVNLELFHIIVPFFKIYVLQMNMLIFHMQRSNLNYFIGCLF